MIEFLNNIDREFFLFLNGFHNSFFDGLMFAATKGLLWMPLYLFFLFFVIRKYRGQTLMIILFAAVMILCSDQLSDLVKEAVHRLRPSRQPGLMVHIVEAYKGGTYGFYSAHASNTFSVVVFLIVILGRKYKFVYVLAILWSLIMSYTRIYLGVHYPGDVITGWVAGGLLGFLFGKGSVLICKLITQSCIKDPISPYSKFEKSSKGPAKTDSH
ncbi:MAG: phosphatase PAP2 family protein [Bacteroidales bacterium]